MKADSSQRLMVLVREFMDQWELADKEEKWFDQDALIKDTRKLLEELF